MYILVSGNFSALKEKNESKRERYLDRSRLCISMQGHEPCVFNHNVIIAVYHAPEPPQLLSAQQQDYIPNGSLVGIQCWDTSQVIEDRP
jgi:hypothetical protein